MALTEFICTGCKERFKVAECCGGDSKKCPTNCGEGIRITYEAYKSMLKNKNMTKISDGVKDVIEKIIGR